MESGRTAVGDGRSYMGLNGEIYFFKEPRLAVFRDGAR